MAYNEFSLNTLIQQFGLEIDQAGDYFAPIPPVPISDLLRQELRENMSLALDMNTEKARSEFIIAPILAELRRQFGGRISLFSGVEFNVDPERGLRGACDFLLSLSPLRLAVRAPVVAVVEAKNENMRAGIAQCLAEMVAAQIFNERQGDVIPTVYGVVTTGSAWRFLRLTGVTAFVDSTEHYIDHAEHIVGILVAMIREAGG